MAKTRFRRKSYRKKTKTSRRQKRKSRRMRGGEVIDKADLIGWAKNNKYCTLKVSAPGYKPEKILSAQQVIDAGNYHNIASKADMANLQPNLVQFESICDYNKNKLLY